MGALSAASGLQRLGDDTLGVHLNGHHFGPGQFGRMAEPGIGKVFGQHNRTIPPQAAQENKADRILATMGQNDILCSK